MGFDRIGFNKEKNMKKMSVISAVLAFGLLSAQAFASVTVTTLNCGSAKVDGNLIVGVGYQVRITSGFDTHVRNPDGTIGAPISPSFELISRVISPSAQPYSTPLKVVSRDSKGNYNLSAEGDSATVLVNQKFSKAIVTLGSGAVAKCK